MLCVSRVARDTFEVHLCVRGRGPWPAWAWGWALGPSRHSPRPQTTLDTERRGAGARRRSDIWINKRVDMLDQ